MRVGVAVAFDGGRNRGMRELATTARHAEAVGLSSLWMPEHVVFIDGAVSRYPYSADGKIALGRRPGVYDPLIALTVAATATERIGLGTGVLILPQREPLTLAQQVVALDHASNGRFELGIGVGWLREEFDALRVPWARRGARADDYIAALRKLWRDDLVTHDGEFTSFAGVLAWPKPLDAGGPPIVVGGNVDASLDRVARIGDGWFGWALQPDEVAERIDALHDRWSKAGRDGRPTVKIGLNWPGPLDQLVPYAERLGAADVDELIVSVAARDVELRQRLDDLAALAGRIA